MSAGIGDRADGSPAAESAPGSIRLPLSRSIEAHGTRMTELELQDADLGCFEDVHMVFEAETDESGKKRVKVHLNMGDAHKVIAGMAGIPRSSARKIAVRDLFAAQEQIANFLGL